MMECLLIFEPQRVSYILYHAAAHNHIGTVAGQELGHTNACITLE
jgi:hypothetical protein